MEKWSFLVGVGLGAAGAAALVHQLYRYRRRYAEQRFLRTSLQDRPTERVRQLKLYHSFPFRSCRCAWLAEELGVLDDCVEVVPVSLHGPEAKGLTQYKREVR